LTFVVGALTLTTGSSLVKLIGTLIVHLLLFLLGLLSFLSSSHQFVRLSNTEAEPIVRSISTLRVLSISTANFKVVIMLDHVHNSFRDFIDVDPASVVNVDIAVTALSVVAVVVLTSWIWWW